MKHSEHVMGTVFSFEIRDIEDPAALGPVLDRLHQIDRTYSTYRRDSVVSRLNHGELDAEDAPDEVREVLAACQAWSARTDGWFDINLDGWIDPSGYVKGWAIDEAHRMLTDLGSNWHSVNGGGDIMALAPPSEKPWRFGIVDPSDPTQLRGVVTGHRVALATSGTAERGSHIYDPFTGRPTETAVASVSVSGLDIIECDVLATAGFACGDAGEDWLRQVDGIEVLVCRSTDVVEVSG